MNQELPFGLAGVVFHSVATCLQQEEPEDLFSVLQVVACWPGAMQCVDTCLDLPAGGDELSQTGEQVPAGLILILVSAAWRLLQTSWKIFTFLKGDV